MTAEPLLAAAVLFTLAVIFVNGWTDAPNAIATVVGTGAMRMERAIALAAACNFFGLLTMTALTATVAATVSGLVDFGQEDPAKTLTALTAALLAIVLWAVAGWAFAIPTSESHALIAALTGAALALQGDFSAVSGSAWCRVLWGLAASVLLGFALGWVLCALIRVLCGGKGQGFFRKAQIFGGAAMAFMHGAQDGQKFLGVLLLAVALGNGGSAGGEIPVWLMLLCSVVMAAGTAVGGKRIIRAVGVDMVPLTPAQGFAADLAGALALLLCTLLGLPTSTTHTKTTAIMGAGAAQSRGTVKLRIVKGILWVWALTFPGCGALGFLLAKCLQG